MPRTKRATKKSYSGSSRSSKASSRGSKASSEGSFSSSERNASMVITDINVQFDVQIAKLDKQLASSLDCIDRNYDMLLCKLPQAILDKPPRDIEQEELKTDSEEVSPMINATVKSSSQKGSHDKERNAMPPPAQSRFRTPMCNVGNSGKYNLITPKIQPNSVLSILRRPREGEMAVSMSGSPLLVSSVTHDNMANINVPLPNGSVMSILPQAGLRPHDLPSMNKETMEQLKRLKDNLTSFLQDQ